MIRIWLLRIIVSWWMIPMVWLVVWPLGWLLFGDTRYINSECQELTRAFWFGD